MKQYLAPRVTEIADYIIRTNATVRAAAKQFAVSKSTVHKDMTERLLEVDRTRYEAVKRVLDINLQERHIRGGIATHNKYLRLSSR